MLYTFNELKEKFKWEQNREISKKEQIRYASSHRVQIEEVGNERPAKFKIVNRPENCYTQLELQIKYKWETSYNVPNFINYAKKRGVLLKKLDFSKRPYYYEIINEENQNLDWIVYKKCPKIEVSKDGQIRNIITKRLLGCTNVNGYVQYRDSNGNWYFVHRIVMETFNPIEDMELLYVDHINGKRDDNRLENLRWASPQDNIMYRNNN